MTTAWVVGGRGGQRGSAALETLLVLPLVALLLVGLLSTLVVVQDQLAVSRAARQAARAVAVTGEVGRGRVVAGQVVPGAQVAVSVTGRVVSVQVRRSGRLLGVGYVARAAAAAPLEPVVP